MSPYGSTYQRWARGDCPCCGWMRADDPYDQDGETTPPRAIGEGVTICGRCVANDHMALEGEDVLTGAILEAILTRSEEPVERAIELARTIHKQ